MEIDKVKEVMTAKWKWYTHYLGLGLWDGSLIFSDSIKEDRWGFTTYAETNADWRYLRFTVTAYPNVMINLSEDKLEDVIVHELMHVFLNEVREAGIDHEERIASSLQRAFSWFETTIRKEEREDVLKEIEDEKEKNTLKVGLSDEDKEILDLLKGTG
jgi:uncharacterized membrane protein